MRKTACMVALGLIAAGCVDGFYQLTDEENARVLTNAESVLLANEKLGSCFDFDKVDELDGVVPCFIRRPRGNTTRMECSYVGSWCKRDAESYLDPGK